MVKIPADFTLPESCAELVEQLARVVYQHGNDNQKGAAMLCTVYFRCALFCPALPLLAVAALWYKGSLRLAYHHGASCLVLFAPRALCTVCVTRSPLTKSRLASSIKH